MARRGRTSRRMTRSPATGLVEMFTSIIHALLLSAYCYVYKQCETMESPAGQDVRPQMALRPAGIAFEPRITRTNARTSLSRPP
jgi:hypothetical protein